ncbi:MAG TPA: hypothetical protein VGF79_01955 [Bacteroidia bacterium]
MKIKTSVLLIVLSLGSTQVSAQSFRKGSMILSITEGTTRAIYRTENSAQYGCTIQTSEKTIDGVRDPFSFEYGISNKWGLGLSIGNDIFWVDNSLYMGRTYEKQPMIYSTTSEFTFDLHYHLLSTKRTDFSLYGSLGAFGVNFNEKYKEQDKTYDLEYKASGQIIRVGGKLRYYFWKRLGAMVMYSAYRGCANNYKKNPEPITYPSYKTTILGTALEFGLCFRLR